MKNKTEKLTEALELVELIQAQAGQNLIAYRGENSVLKIESEREVIAAARVAVGGLKELRRKLDAQAFKPTPTGEPEGNSWHDRHIEI